MPRYINIDTEDKTDQTTTIILESVSYVARLRYNDRSNWQMSLYDYDLYDADLDDNSEAKIYGERALMPAQNFFKYTHGADNLPTGYLVLSDSTFPSVQDYELPTRYNLGQGKRFLLVYFTKDEFDAYSAEDL